MTTENKMPVLLIEATGAITSSNFEPFAIAARQWLAAINRTLTTDEDFSQADLDAKKAKEVEEMLALTREGVLAKAETLNAELTKLSDLSEEMRQARLTLTGQIDKAKAERRKQLAADAESRLICDPSMRSNYRHDIAEATKGKRTLATMEDAAGMVVKIVNGRIEKSRALIAEFIAANGSALVMDSRSLECSTPDIVAAELRRRLEAAAAEAERKRLQSEADRARQEAATARAAADAEKAKAEVAKLATTTPAAQEPPWAGGYVTDSPTAKESLTDHPAEDEMSEVMEWQAFANEFVPRVSVLKCLRAALRYPANIAKAATLATSINAAWKEANQ